MNAKEPKYTLTTGQIAKTIGYSAQSVRNAVRDLGLEPVSKTGKGSLYSVDQANLISQKFGKGAPFVEPEQSDTPDGNDALIKSQQEQIEALRQQLKEKDRQISSLLENLTTAQSQLTQALDANRALSASTLATNADKLLVARQEEVGDKEPEQELTRWQHFKAVFRRKKKG